MGCICETTGQKKGSCGFCKWVKELIKEKRPVYSGRELWRMFHQIMPALLEGKTVRLCTPENMKNEDSGHNADLVIAEEFAYSIS